MSDDILSQFIWGTVIAVTITVLSVSIGYFSNLDGPEARVKLAQLQSFTACVTRAPPADCTLAVYRLGERRQ